MPRNIASLENCYTHNECTYDETAFNVCGNGICEDGTSYIPDGEEDSITSKGWGENEDNCSQDCSDCSFAIPGDINNDELLDIFDIIIN